MSADPAVMEFLMPLAGPGACEAWAARLRAHWRDHGFGRWVVELPGTASFVGVVGLAWIPYQAHFTPAVEVAWRLARAYLGPRLCRRGGAGGARLRFRQAWSCRDCRGHGAGQSAFAAGDGTARHEPRPGGRLRPPERPRGPAQAARALPAAQSRGRGVTILLVRHGETEWNRERRHQGRFDSPLTRARHRTGPRDRPAAGDIAGGCCSADRRQPARSRPSHRRDHS